MTSPAVIEFSHVSKFFARGARRQFLRGRVQDYLKQGPREKFVALNDVSFQIEKGEAVAVIGANGAGKSTLLALVAQLSRPDRGAVEVRGRVAALLELGSGFHSDLSGRENVHLNASLLGLSRARMKKAFDEIVEFSGISDFIDEPLRTYSSGMVLRLAFSVAVHVDPDILIIDEMLAVGDQHFQEKCLRKIVEFRQIGKTLLCVSHVASAVQQLCNRALWLEHGKLIMDGQVNAVVDGYRHQQDPWQAT